MKITVFDLTGKKVKDIEADKSIFEAKVNEPLMAQAVRIFQTNQRLGAARSKTRAEVDRTRKKTYRQKGTGGARHGDKKSPVYVGGGKAHGPKLEQHFDLNLPAKMRIAALRSALSLYAKEGRILAVSGLTGIEKPKTKTMSEFLQAICPEKKDCRKIGMVFTAKMENAVKSSKNLEPTFSYFANNLTAYHVLNSNKLVMALEALEELTKRLSNK